MTERQLPDKLSLSVVELQQLQLWLSQQLETPEEVDKWMLLISPDTFSPT